MDRINLAVKLITVQPGLTPSEVIKLVQQGADELEGQQRIDMIHPGDRPAVIDAMQQGVDFVL